MAFCGGAWNRKEKYKHGIIYFYSHIQEACGTIKRVKFKEKACEILGKKNLPGVSSSDVRHGKSKRLSSCCHVQGRRPRRPSRKTKGDHFVLSKLNTNIQTEPEQELFEVDFRADSNASVFSFCWSNRYVDSNAIVFWFIFVGTLIHIYINAVAPFTHTYTWSFL